MSNSYFCEVVNYGNGSVVLSPIVVMLTNVAAKITSAINPITASTISLPVVICLETSFVY